MKFRLARCGGPPEWWRDCLKRLSATLTVFPTVSRKSTPTPCRKGVCSDWLFRAAIIAPRFIPAT
jgi:hypothetical protein